jgi:hypothetical protein
MKIVEMPSLKNLICLLWLILFSFLQCAPPSSTLLIDSWSNDTVRNPGFENVLIVGIARRPEIRKSFENQLKARLQSKQVNIVASLEVLPPDEKIDAATFHKYFDDKNIDAVIVTRLLAVDELPSGSPSGRGEQMDAETFYQYYENSYGNQAEEVMDGQNLILRVETNLYETKQEKKIWTCVSKSFQQGNTERILGDLTKVIAKALKEDGYF